MPLETTLPSPHSKPLHGDSVLRGLQLPHLVHILRVQGPAHVGMDVLPACRCPSYIPTADCKWPAPVYILEVAVHQPLQSAARVSSSADAGHTTPSPCCPSLGFSSGVGYLRDACMSYSHSFIIANDSCIKFPPVGFLAPAPLLGSCPSSMKPATNPVGPGTSPDPTEDGAKQLARFPPYLSILQLVYVTKVHDLCLLRRGR